MKTWVKTILTDFASLRHLVRPVKFGDVQSGWTGKCCFRTSSRHFCFEWFSRISLKGTEYVGGNAHFHVLGGYPKLCGSPQGTARQVSLIYYHGQDGGLLTGRNAESFLLSLDFSHLARNRLASILFLTQGQDN